MARQGIIIILIIIGFVLNAEGKEKKAMIEDHPNYTTIQAFVESVILTVRNKQAEFFTKHKYYFQGLRIPNTGELDGTSQAQIQYGLRPEGREHSWHDFDPDNFKVDTKFPVHLRLDCYDGPNGPGWILNFELYKDLGPDGYGNEGTHWYYQHNEGPLVRPGIWDEWFILVEEK